MAVRKLSANEVPSDILGDLKSLKTDSKKVYVAIGNSYYEVFPTSAMVLMEAIAELVDILDEIRKKKVERIKSMLSEEQLKEFNPLSVVSTIDDIVTDKDAISKLKGLLPKLLNGADPDDIEMMTIGQLIDCFDKIISVNMETLPPSYRKQLEERQSQFLNKSENGNEESASKNP